MICYVERWDRIWNDGVCTDIWEAIGVCNVYFDIAQDQSMILTVCHVDHTVGFNVSAFNVRIDDKYIHFEGTIKIEDKKHEFFKVRMKQV